MANIPKLRLMLARMEKTASRWRTVQGLTALLGKDTVAATPRFGALQLAAKQQGIKLPGEGFAKAMSSLPEGPIGASSSLAPSFGKLAPTQVFRGGGQPADLIRGGYSTDYLHATPFKHTATDYGHIDNTLPVLALRHSERKLGSTPPTGGGSLVGVYGTTKNQRYMPDFGFERDRTQLMGNDRIDPTRGLSYAYRAWQDSNLRKNFIKNFSHMAYDESGRLSRRYETLVKPSQLQSVLLNDRVLPATAKGRELLQTGTMPAGAKLPPEILKSATELDKEAGIADIANRVLSTLIKSPVTPSFVKNTFYPGFPAVREALRATGRVKTVVPSTGVGDIPTFAVRGENSPAFKALRSQFKTMVPENQTPEGVFDKITTEMSGTPLQRTYSGWVAKNQAMGDFKHDPWSEIYTPPGAHYRSNTNNIVNFTPNTTKFMRHELTHGLQFQLPNNFNSLHTLSTGTKLPVTPVSGWTTVRGTAAPNRSNFLMEMNANAAMSRTPLGQIGEAISFATDPRRARYYAPKYTPTEKWVHDTLSFPRDIPRRVAAKAGQLMDWIDSKIIGPPNLTKGAGVFTASGNKVQGVGLRKLYHSLLDERGLTGLGVNNEDTGDVELSFDGDEARRKEVFKELAARIKAKTSHPVTFAPTTVPQTSTSVRLSNKDAERLNAIHHLAYRMSNMYDPTHPLMDPNDTFKQKLADRFRLQVNQRGLEGTVPSRAAEQLLGTRPMYAGMMPARRTRSEAEALSDMPMPQQQRLLKALKSGRGFLAPVVDKLASAHEYAANDPAMRILSQSPVTDKDFLYHASGKKFNALDPKYNSKRSYGHEYTEPVVFAGDAPSSAFASNPTAEYQAVKDKMKDSVYHRLIDELTGRKALLGHTPGGYLYKLPASAFTRIDREDNELGKWNKSTEYVSHRPVKPVSVTPMQSTDVDAIPEYEYLGKDFVGEMPAQHYLKHAKNPKVIAAIQTWLANKEKSAAAKKELVRVKLDNDEGKSLMHHYLNAKKWDYPAGKVEPNEKLEDAAVRELMERTGHNMNKSKLKYNGFSDGFHQYSGLLADIAKISPAYYETGEPRQLSWGKVPDDVLTKHAGIAQLGMAAARGLYGLGSAAVKSPIAQNIATGASNLVNRAGNLANGASNLVNRAGNLANTAIQNPIAQNIATGARNAGSSLYAKANDLTNAAIQSPITPDFIKNTFKPGYAAVKDALKRTGRSWAPDYSKASPPFKSVMKPTATSPDSAHRLWTADTTFTPHLAMPGQGGAYYPKANLATSTFPKGTENGMRFMRHELAHGLQFQMPQPIAGGLNSLHTASKGSGNIFLQELNANAAMSRTPLGQMGRAIGFAANPVQLANYWQQYKPIDKLMHGAAASVLPAAFGVRTYAGGYLSPTPKATLDNQDEEINPSPDDVLTKHAGIAQLGMAAAKGLYGLGSAAVKSPIAQNIATGASNLVNRAGNIATRAGNLANSAMQSRAGKSLITGAENLHEGTVNVVNNVIQHPIVSRLYAGANKLTDAAIQSPMTPDFIKNTFKPGYEAGRQALRRTSRQWVPNWDAQAGLVPIPKRPVDFGKNSIHNSPDRLFRKYKAVNTPQLPPSTDGGYWNKLDQIAVDHPRGTEIGMRVMRHELTHGLQHQLPSNFNSLQTASVNSPFAGSFLREMNANAAMSRTPLGQMGAAIGYATSPDRLKAYWDTYKPIDKLMHGAAVGTAYGVPLATATVAGGVGTYNGLHSLASWMQPTALPHNPEFAQAGPPNPDDVLTKHANLARLGMAAAKGLYGLGSAAVKSPIAQNIATGASNLVNRAGNLANTAIQNPSAIGSSLASGASNLVNNAGSSLYAGANSLTNAAIQSPMTPAFIKNTFKPGYVAVRQALRNTTRQFGAAPAARVGGAQTNQVLPNLPRNANGAFWPSMNHAATSFDKGTAKGLEVMRHELAHGLQYNLPSSLPSLQTASLNSPFAGSFLREMNANAASSRTPLGQIGRAIRYATSPERLQAYTRSGHYKLPDKLMHNAAIGTAYGVPLAAATAVGGIGTYNGLQSLASRMQPTDSSNANEFAQAGPPNPHTEESFPEEVA